MSSYKILELNSKEPWLIGEKEEDNGDCHLKSKAYLSRSKLPAQSWFES